MLCIVLEAYACSDCARLYLVEDAAGADTVCPVCQSPASEFSGLYEVKKVDQKPTAAGGKDTSGGN